MSRIKIEFVQWNIVLSISIYVSVDCKVSVIFVSCILLNYYCFIEMAVKLAYMDRLIIEEVGYEL